METAKHFGSKLRKTLAALLATMALMAVLLPGALAVDLNVDVGFYFKQSRGGTCTLASAAMMLRRRAYLDGMDSWVDVTENGIKSTAWSGGLSHSFTYNDMHVGYATLPSGKAAKTEALVSILAEHPELTAGEAIAQSKAMMAGNRWRLFCLQFSFIGWDILCALTLGIGNLALRPYRHAAEAAFYRELCGGTVPEDEEYSA